MLQYDRDALRKRLEAPSPPVMHAEHALLRGECLRLLDALDIADSAVEKYMQHVGNCEGVDFVRDRIADWMVPMTSDEHAFLTAAASRSRA